MSEAPTTMQVDSVMIFTFTFVWSAYLAIRHRKGIAIACLLCVPLFMFVVVFQMTRFSPLVNISFAFVTLIIFFLVDFNLDSRRARLSRLNLIRTADSFTAVVIICVIVPLLVSFVAGIEFSVLLAVLLLCACAIGLTWSARNLVDRLRIAQTPKRQPFQVGLMTALACSTLLATLIAFQEIAGLIVFFVGTGIFYGGFSLIPAARPYMWTGIDQQIIAQQRTGSLAVILGLAVMLVGIANVLLA